MQLRSTLPSAATRIHNAILAVKRGSMPEFTAEEVLEQLNLAGDLPDGLSLFRRSTGWH